MKLDKKQMIYAGVGVLVLLVLISSTKKVVLEEVTNENTGSKSFDNSLLPSQLKPPYRLAEGEPLPRLAKKNYSFSGMGLKPRFDT
jgi:hypothetical protein